MRWFKFYGVEYLGDPKMLALTAAERSCWITLLSFASLSDETSEQGVVKYVNEATLMLQAGINFQDKEWEKTIGVLDHFKKLGMVTIDNGVITIEKWKKRQDSNLTGYERLKKHRKKQRDNSMITGDNATKNEADNALITPMITVDKNRIDKNRIEHPFGVWNSHPSAQKFPRAGSIRNTGALKRLLPKCRGITPEIKKAFSKLASYSDKDFEVAIKNYILDIINRDPRHDYSTHRFSFCEFFKQENGFLKFINK